MPPSWAHPLATQLKGSMTPSVPRSQLWQWWGAGSACSMRMMHFASSKMLSPYPRCSTLCELPLFFYLRSSRASMTYRDLCWQTLPTSPLMPMIQPGSKLFSHWGLEGWGSGVLLSLHLLPSWPLLPVPPSSPVRSSHLVYRRHPALLTVWPSLSGVVGMMSPLHLPQPLSFRGPGMLSVCHWHTGTSWSLLQMHLHGPPACRWHKGVRGMATGPPCIIVGFAHGQGGGLSGHGPLPRDHTVPPTCANIAKLKWTIRAFMG